MKVDKKEYEIIQKALSHWSKDQLIDTELKDKLSQTLDNSKSDIGNLTYYVFIAAISCAILAFGALVLDEKWIERMRSYFSFTETTIGIVFGILTFVLLFIIKKRKQKYPDMQLANESLSLVMLFSTGVAVAYIGRALGLGMQQFAPMTLITALLIGFFALFTKSRFLWLTMIIGLTFWFLYHTYTWTVLHNAKWLGMNIPLRMTLFSLLIWGSTWILKNIKSLQLYVNQTFYAGLIMTFLAAWLLSIMGNYNYDNWILIRQGKVVIFAIIYTILIVLGIWIAIKRKDVLMRDVLLIFFMLNLYTRYFEYFWDKTNKGLFFAIMACSFWLFGRQLERFRKKQDELMIDN